jgi:hypothetical protein
MIVSVEISRSVWIEEAGVANSAFKRVGDTMLWLCNANPPRDSEWHGYVAAIKGAVAESTGKQELRFLVLTDGGGPNATQRSASTENDLVKNTRTALVTGSLLARGIATAYSWFDVRIRAFSPTDISRALEFLELKPPTALPLWNEVLLLHREIEGGVQTIDVASQILLRTTNPVVPANTRRPPV